MGVETTETTAMGGCGDDMGPCGDYGDDVGTTWGPRGDNEITKNAITFEQIEIIEFCLKICDP